METQDRDCEEEVEVQFDEEEPECEAELTEPDLEPDLEDSRWFLKGELDQTLIPAVLMRANECLDDKIWARVRLELELERRARESGLELFRALATKDAADEGELTWSPKDEPDPDESLMGLDEESPFGDLFMENEEDAETELRPVLGDPFESDPIKANDETEDCDETWRSHGGTRMRLRWRF